MMCEQIATKFLMQLAYRLKTKDITLDWDKAVAQRVGALGQDANFGARPMKRYIQDWIETPIAKLIIGQDLTNKTIHIETSGESEYHFTITD